MLIWRKNADQFAGQIDDEIDVYLPQLSGKFRLICRKTQIKVDFNF